VNTINKWAAGICDTLPLGILVEGIGKQLPIAAIPFTNYAQAAHPAFERNIRKLRSWGIDVLYGPEVYRLHAPGTGNDYVQIFPWRLALAFHGGSAAERRA
jgi:phosphopantothenoylcysteine synthetase/decarboxylase